MTTIVGTSHPKNKLTHWGIADDGNQWIVSFLSGKPNKLRWVSRSFVGSNKTVLRRVLRELGVTLTESGERYVVSLPDKYGGKT